MKTRLAICLTLAASAASLPMPAAAQALLPPHEIATSVRSMGIEPITRPVLRGSRYVLRAIDDRGVEVTVAADALSGRVLRVRPVGFGERPVAGPVYADRVYPRVYPQETVPPRGGYERPRSYQQQGSYEPPPDRPPARIPGEPSVIYAPRDATNPQTANPQSANRQTTTPQPPARAPVTGKPPAAKVVASKPAAQPPAAAETAAAPAPAAPEQPTTTGTTPSPQTQTDKPALAIPLVQSLE